MILRLMTWNLGKNKPYGSQGTALDLACDWIKRQPSAPKVIAFQECTDPGEIEQNLAPGPIHVYSQGTICLASTLALSCIEKQSRFIAGKANLEGQEISFISYHGTDRKSLPDETARGGQASE
jgi:hypothetical protein